MKCKIITILTLNKDVEPDTKKELKELRPLSLMTKKLLKLD